jgi:DHA2 family multidrug resistance protein
MRNLGGAIGIAVSSTMLNDRLNLHYERLDEHVTAGRPIVEGLLQQQAARLAAIGGDTLNAGHAGLDLLHTLLMREALVLTFSDAYLAVALCFVVALVSVAFSRPFGLNVPPPDAH